MKTPDDARVQALARDARFPVMPNAPFTALETCIRHRLRKQFGEATAGSLRYSATHRRFLFTTSTPVSVADTLVGQMHLTHYLDPFEALTVQLDDIVSLLNAGKIEQRA